MSETIDIALDKLTEPFYNPRVHPQEQVYNLSLSLKEFGQRRTIAAWPVGDGTYEVLAGNGIKAAAVMAGWSKLSCTLAPQDMTIVQRKAYALADNQGGAVDDMAKVAQILEEVSADGRIALEALGSSQAGLDALLEDLANQALAGQEPGNGGDDYDTSQDVSERSKIGDIWELGTHRLLVGSCTDKDQIARLFDGERAELILTSPPYTDQRDYKIGEFNWLKLMCCAFDRMLEIAQPDCHILVNLGMSHKNRQVDMYWSGWLDYAKELGWPLFAWYVWDKGSGMPGEWNGRLAPSHEFLFHFNLDSQAANKWIETSGESAKRGASGKRFRQKDGTLRELTSPDKIGQPFKVPDSVIRINREMARGIHTQNHPAVFPIAFPEFIINTWSQAGDVVFEPFCGSGTTIIAAQRTGRVCYASELEPKYADVIIARWEAETNQTAKLIERVAND